MEGENTTTKTQAHAFEIQSDELGNWNLIVDKNLSEGPHVLMVEDEYGNTDEALIYIVKQSQSPNMSNFGLIDRVTNTVPQLYFATVWFLVFLVAIASLDIIYLSRKVHFSIGKNISSWFKHFNIILAISLIILSVSSALFLNYKSGHFGIDKKTEDIILKQISGQLLDPLTLQGIKADLMSGNTTIKTSESGYFVFNDINITEGIHLTHPQLLRAVTYLPDKKQDKQMINWYFTPEMYNVLIQVLNDEARGKFEEVYKKLPEKIKQKVELTKFIADYKTFLKPNNIKDQTILLKEVNLADNWVHKSYDILFDKVYIFKIINNNEVENYYLVNEEGKWRVFK